MAKSKRKSGSSTDVSRWETELAQANINEEDWKALIVFAVPDQPEDVTHISIMADIISTGTRKLFSVIDYDLLMKEVKDLAHGKAMKGKIGKPPQFVEIVDSIKNVVDHGEDISSSLLAKLLKFKLLMLKQKDLERREEEKKTAELAAKQTKQEDRSRSKAGSSHGKRSKSQSPGRKKGKKDDAPLSPKKDTKLKRRGDLDETIKTIDDEPDSEDDPNHYIVISGVNDAHVFQCLLDLGVSTDAVIKIKAESKLNDKVEDLQDDKLNLDCEENGDENAHAVQEKVNNAIKSKEKIAKFWREIEVIIKEAASGCKMKDIANLTVLIEEAIIPEGELTELQQDLKTDYGTKLFDNTAICCYELLNSRKRYRRYLKNLHLTHVLLSQECLQSKLTSSNTMKSIAEVTEDGKAEGIGNEQIDLRYYRHLMDQFSCESHSVGLILDSLLRQVDVTVNQTNPMQDLITPRDDLLDDVLGNHLDQKLRSLGIENEPLEINSGMKTANHPTVIKYGDKQSYRLFNLRKVTESSPESIEKRMNSLHPISALTRLPPLTEEEKVAILNRKQHLNHFCSVESDDVNLDKLIALLCLESIPLKHVGLNGNIVSPSGENVGPQEDIRNVKKEELTLNFNWDDPYFKDFTLAESYKAPSVNGDQEKSPITEDLPEAVVNRLENYCYLEYFDNDILMQVLQEAMELLPSVDWYFHRGLDSVLIVLHNPRDHRLQNKQTWSTWLHSNVGFRNYLEHVAEAVNDWQRQEDIIEEAAKQPVESKTPERESTPELLKTSNRNNLMKRSEMEELKAAEDEKNKKKGKKSRSRSGSPNKRAPTDVQKTKSPDKKDRTSSGKKRAPSARKAGSRMGTARKPGKLCQEKKTEEEEHLKTEVTDNSEKEYPFHGYDVGDNLIHVSGKKIYLFPQDGGLVKIDKTDYINGHCAVRTSLFKDNNFLIIHHVNPLTTTQPEDNKMNFPVPQADAGEMEMNGNETLNLFSTLPTLPEFPAPVSEAGCLSLTLEDGLHISMEPATHKGMMQKMSDVTLTLADIQAAGISLHTTTGTSTGAPTAKTSSPKGKRKQEDEAKKQEEIEKQNEIEMREKIKELSRDIFEMRKFSLSRKNMAVSVPDGLHVLFLHGEVEETGGTRVLYVRQEHPLGADDVQTREKLQVNSSLEEKSRTITMDGTVIKYMMDGSVVVLFCDGSVCSSPSNDTQQVSDTDLSSEVKQSTNRDASINKSPVPSTTTKNASADENIQSFTDQSYPEWYLVNVLGERYYKKAADTTEIQLDNLHMSYAVCPKSFQILETREDGAVIVKRSDGTRIVEHSDGTRITTFLHKKTKHRELETGEEEMYLHEDIELIKVEGIGLATVLIDKQKRKMQTVFGNGTLINANLNGSYEVSKPDSTKLFVSEQGDIIFAPRNVLSYNLPTENIFEYIDQNSLPTGVYLFRSSSVACFSTVDCGGNKFTVSSSGEANIDRAQNEKAHEPDNAEEVVLARYFIVHRDGQGEELLHKSDVSSYLEEADKDPLVAVIKSETAELPGLIDITTLKPIKGCIGQHWLKEKDEKEIIPYALQERNFKTLPSKEIKNPGPKFGSDAGIAFQIASKSSKRTSTPRVACPSILHMRRLVKFNGLDAFERQRMEKALKCYRAFMKEQFDIEHGWLPKDPRSMEENSLADELSTKLLPKFEQMKLNQKNLLSLEQSADYYANATAPLPSPPAQKAQPERSQAQWEKDKIQIAEWKSAKHYLKSGFIPPYFDTEEGQSFLYRPDSNLNIDEMALNLARNTVNPAIRPVSIESSEDGEPRIASVTNRSGPSELNGVISRSSTVKLTIDDMRPGNPTPAVAMKYAANSGCRSNNNGEERPYNPTPLKATINIQGSNLTNIEQNQPDCSSHYSNNCSLEFQKSEDPPTKSKKIDFTATKELRDTSLILPRSIQGSRPGALPNDRFAGIEEGVRRQVKTTSIAGSVNPQSTASMRGFKLVPDSVDFGVLKEGMAYVFPVFLENVGVDSCRFKVKQPPPSTGVKVRFKTGLVAAGLSVRLDIEIFAVAVGVEGNAGAGSIGHHIEIITETDAMYLPVKATILTAQEYKNGKEFSALGGPSSSTMLLKDRPTSREELTRPRKDL